VNVTRRPRDMMIDCSFRLLPGAVPLEHGYSLLSALSRIMPSLHGDIQIGVHPIRGRRTGANVLTLDGDSRLRIRAPVDRVGELLALAGRFLDVGGHEIGLGVPELWALAPATTLYSRLVTIKGFTEPGPFLEAARRQMDAMGVSGRLEVPTVPEGPRAGLPRRRVVRVRQMSVVGFAIVVEGLSDADSLTLQERGLGGRRRMGCGIFVPVRNDGGTGDES